NGVVGRGGAVDEGVEPGAEVLDANALPSRELFDAGHDADRLVLGCGRRLVEDDPSFGRVADQIGEGAADVDADSEAVAHRLSPGARGTQAAVSWTRRGSSDPTLRVALLGGPGSLPQIPGVGYSVPTPSV